MTITCPYCANFTATQPTRKAAQRELQHHIADTHNESEL